MIIFKQEKPTLAIHKFTSCDGCQLALLNLGPDLLELAKLVDIKHFAEAGIVASEESVDIALIEGSISTRSEQQRIQRIRQTSKYVIALGACATSGGIQALRNISNAEAWLASLYPDTSVLDSLTTSTPIEESVRVDFTLRGCPVSCQQLIDFLLQLTQKIKPKPIDHSVCQDCKRNQTSCVMVTKQIPCMGPVTQAGCNALCPRINRGCFGCYGPTKANTVALAKQFKNLGMSDKDIKNSFLHINSHSSAFSTAANSINEDDSSHE